MLKLLRIIFGVITVALAIYGLITNNMSEIMVYMQFFLAAMFLVIGLSELQKRKKEMAFVFFFVSGCVFLELIFIL